MNKLIIISGPSCTGKTTLANYIADKINYPVLSKDGIKENLFNSLGWKDLEWSKQLGAASMSLLYYLLEEGLKRNQSLIIEANFKPKIDTEKLTALMNKYKPEVLELHCFADPDVLWDRFVARSESGERHPGHLDDKSSDEAKQAFLNSDLHSALKIGRIMKIDASDFKKIDYDKIVEQVVK